jgi:ATP-binding protein involved in chromosome partitioning
MTNLFSSQHLKEVLKTIKYPGFNRDIVSFGLVQEAHFEGGAARVRLVLTSNDPEMGAKLENQVREGLKGVDAIEALDVAVEVKPPAHATASYATKMPKGMENVKYVIAIASGKGGVGKSTVSVNLALALKQAFQAEGLNKRVGIMDCDIYGPSIPLMVGLNERPQINAAHQIVPLENFGIKVMSMGFLIDEHAPVVWRGPMITKTIQQFGESVAWGEIEVLVVDLPPGTGDAHLTLAQTLPLSGALIVTTPQAAAYHVATRGALMFEKVNVPILGVVENMSYFEDPLNGERLSIFGDGGGELTSQALQAPLLGQIPLDPQIRQGGDFGIPITLSHPDSKSAQAFRSIAEKILLNLASREQVAMNQ